MAICKIIPIKQARGVKDCLDYIANDEKVISIKETGKGISTVQTATKMDETEEERFLASMDFHTVLAYMENSEKTHRVDDVNKKYISGYLCTPETAVQEFLKTKEDNLFRKGQTLTDETGNWAYHIIQSFPENLDISDDEIHQCGRELCEKLGAYQAVICSHVHPVIDEEGEVSGKCKHNHILINSHMHPDKQDPEKPNIYKYHDCKESYAQLQQWNDEISLAHGLPIIRNPELNRKYSWYKSKKENEDASWTKQVARDIKNTMRFCSNWEQFKEQMTEQGYFIRETSKNITYYTPEHTEAHKQQIREKRLGREYTRAELERYWESIEKTSEKSTTERTTKANLIKKMVEQYDTNLFTEVVIKNKHRTYTLDIQIKNPRRQIVESVINTYFEPEKTYNLCTSDHVPIAEVTGQDIFDYYEELQREKERKQKKDELHEYQDEYYFEKSKISSETKKPYVIPFWDETGRRRTVIELKCLLAVKVIKHEHAPEYSQPSFSFKGPDGKYIYAKTDWKIQNMYNTITMAREMEIENSADVTQKLDRAGKEVARLRKQLKILTGQHNQMQTIFSKIEELESVREICESIYKITDSEQKTQAEETYRPELEQYKAAKRYLHTKNINSAEQIAEFKERYESMTAHLQEIEEDLTTINQEYRNLKKINYNLTLTQNSYYCYGPEHEMFANEKPEEKMDQEQENNDIH